MNCVDSIKEDPKENSMNSNEYSHMSSVVSNDLRKSDSVS